MHIPSGGVVHHGAEARIVSGTSVVGVNSVVIQIIQNQEFYYSRCETPDRLQCISKLYAILWYDFEPVSESMNE